MANLNKFEKMHHLQEMRDRVTLTFFERKVLDKYLQLISVATEDMQEMLRVLMQERSVDTAIGKQLDIIGDIVGQPREVRDAAFVEWFGYNNAPGASPYGYEGRTDVGGRYWDNRSDLTKSVLLTDDDYRVFIKAKIVKNTTRATPEDLISYLRFVFNAAFVHIEEGGEINSATVTITVGGNFTDFEMALLSNYRTKYFDEWFFPKPLGVGITFNLVSPIPFRYWEFDDEVGKGYGSDTNPDVQGGSYAGLV